ncbi:pilus assembly protein TadG-related protein [Homoserinimonas sp. OAct 916]|uniref:pilus assembly protein TadG-related protein n=1 Tax=Homoserinimonas sp. OAct 916 TaxID=2211450 RepID=UPI000DBE4335|nr:pilus assembly protein TadG-related protein [Homoserinimonas sp. OAct 916]
MNRLRNGAGDDRGSTLLLTIFYGFLALALIFVTLAASSLYLERKRLFTLADSAALVGAEAFSLEGVATHDGEVRPGLRTTDVYAAVSDYLAGTANHRFHGLRLARAETSDGMSATVELTAEWRPPIASLVLPRGVPLSVTADARAVFW